MYWGRIKTITMKISRYAKNETSARRTVAKYREQLDIVARLRKILVNNR
jgi:DNA-directed RNA polymerase specialized sigma54-like protein